MRTLGLYFKSIMSNN